MKPHHPTRAAVLLLLIGRCREHVLDGNTGSETNIRTYEERFRRLLEDSDAAVAYYASLFILRRLIRHRPTEYRLMLKRVVNSSRVTRLFFLSPPSFSVVLLLFCLVFDRSFPPLILVCLYTRQQSPAKAVRCSLFVVSVKLVSKTRAG